MSEVVSSVPAAAQILSATKPVETVKPAEAVKSEISPNIDKFASKFAALTRKEREFNQTAKQKEEEYSKKMLELQEKQSRFAPYEGVETEIKAGNKKKAIEFLMQQGLSVEELTEMLVQEQNPDPELKLKRSMEERDSKLMKEIENLKLQLKKEKEDEITARKNEEEERAKLQHDTVIKKVLDQLTAFVNNDEADYTLIKQYNSIDLVYETMQAHYDEQLQAKIPDTEIKILSYKEACDKVEEYLAEEVKKTYEAKWNRPVPKEDAKENQLAQTLTNTLSAEVPKSGEVRFQSDEESKRAAAKLLRWAE